MANSQTRCYHHKDNSLQTGSISCSSPCSGCLTICREVNINYVVMQHMPNGDKHLSCHSHQDIHLVVFPILASNDVAVPSFMPGMLCRLLISSGNSLSQISSILAWHFSLCASAMSSSSRSCDIMSISARLTTPLSDAVMTSMPWWLMMRPCISLTNSSGGGNPL